VRFGDAVEALGQAGLVEIIAIIGYYTLIGDTLNAFQVPLPEGTDLPFSE
jgi:4-carboxymuconolactone decarboxylase